MASDDVISEFFRTQPLSELSTSTIVKQLYPQEYERIKTALHDPLADKESKVIAKRRKGQLHRRALYHINRLVDQGFLRVSTHQGKGEKVFSVKHKSLTQFSKAHKEILRISVSHPLVKLEAYQDQHIISIFNPANWHNRLNAILLDLSSADTLDDIAKKVRKVSVDVNDVIGIIGFEYQVRNEPLDRLTSFMKGLDIDCRDSSRSMCFVMDIKLCTDSFLDFLSSFVLLESSNISIVMQLSEQQVRSHHKLLKSLVRVLSESRVKINVQNTDAHRAPLLVGRAGVYTIEDEEWDVYLSEVRGKTIGLCYAQVSVGIDVKRFFSQYPSQSEFRLLVRKVARSLVESSTLQRRNADTSFSDINSLNDHPSDFYRFSVNYIRLWNYDWTGQEQPYLMDLLVSSSSFIDEFCHTEETIFKSCGIPIRFRATLSSAFLSFQRDIFSKRSYVKMTVRSSEDFSHHQFKRFLERRELLFRVFRATDRLRIFRALPADPSDIIREFSLLFSQYSFPFVCYDFSKRKESLTLDHFMT